MKKTLYIPLDTTLDNTVECEKLIKRGDILTLTIKVFSNGALANLTNESIDLILRKSDNTLIETTVNSSNISNGVITANLSQQATLAQGLVSGELQIYTNNTLASTNTFTFVVDSSLADDVLEVSVNDIQVLADLRNLINESNIVLVEYENSVLAIGNSVEAVEALANIKLYIDTNLPDLENANAEAVVNIANETIKNTEATQNINDLTNKNILASSNISDLNNKNTAASQNISDLDSKNTTASSNISSLDSKNITASNNISALDTKNSTASTNLTNLDTENIRSEANLTAMQEFGDVTEVLLDVTALKNEMTNARGGQLNVDARIDLIENNVSNNTSSLLENTQKLTEITTNYNIYASSADTNGFYTVVDYKRADNTLYMHSVWSNVDTNGFYQTCTQTYYEANGTTVKIVKTYTIAYDSNGKITSIVEVIV